MIGFVNAKINLGLNITRRRADGYHDLQTVFYPIGIHSGTHYDESAFCDIIEIVESPNTELFTKGREVGCPGNENLVWKAYLAFHDAFSKRFGTMPGFTIILDKHLPDGAGMGGGSADASTTLLMLDKLTGCRFTHNELAEIAISLGADCPFFIYNRPMYAEGIGEKMSCIEVPLQGMWAVIAKPGINISTREAFGNITPRIPEKDIREIIALPISQWKHMLKNDFEDAMFLLHPEIAEIKNSLYDKGASYASMTGSGSAFYGIFPSKNQANAAASEINAPYIAVTRL